MRKLIGLVVALVVGFIAYFVGFNASSGLFGAGIESKVLPDPAAAPGWKKVEPVGAGYSFHVPEGLTVFDPKDPRLDALLTEGAKLNPQLEPQVRQIMANDRLSMMAMDLQNLSEANAGRNINVILMPKNGKIRKKQSELDAYRSEMEKQAPPGASVVSVEFAEIPIGTTIRTVLTFPTQGMNGPVPLQAVGYIVVGKDTMYNITYTAQKEAFTDFEAIAAKSMETFRVKG